MNTKKKEKIAILGNMNNFGFSLLRYFIRLDINADLLIFSNEDIGDFSHFSINADSFEANNYETHIVRLEIPDFYFSGLDIPFPNAINFFIKFLKPHQSHIRLINKNKLKKNFEKYDYIIGSGISPALLSRINKKLDIFFPYSIGIEFFGTSMFTKDFDRDFFLKNFFKKKVMHKQLKGIRDAKFVFNGDLGANKTILNKYQIPFKVIGCPMVYVENSPLNMDSSFQFLLKKIENKGFKILAHARHIWTKESLNHFGEYSKNNDWIIRSYAKFYQKYNRNDSILILFEYGSDVENSKRLCSELNLNDVVIWIPKMERKFILELIKKIDLVVGEFIEIENTLFGGVGYEALACGKPLVNGFLFDNNYFEESFGYEIPPLLQVKEEVDILNHLEFLYFNPEIRRNIGLQSKEWFDKYNGIGLAKKWFDFIQKN